MQRFDEHNFQHLCNELAGKDKRLQGILDEHGYPPMWTRPNHFETLVLTILEQQVSLAAAYAAYKKLKEKISITPENILTLTDEELRSCYFTRQKTGYVRGLAKAVLSKEIVLKEFEEWDNDKIRAKLKSLKGIGDWTVDIYLIHVLQRTDIFPLGDLALVNAVRMLVNDKNLAKNEISLIAEDWKPYRTIATMMLWHLYIKKRNIKILH
jgi:DNA-3-methyladenine glycosylase II